MGKLVFASSLRLFFYKFSIGSPEDKLAAKKAIKAVPKAKKIYSPKETQIEDVKFKLIDIKQITFGEGFDITVDLYVNAPISLLFHA